MRRPRKFLTILALATAGLLAADAVAQRLTNDTGLPAGRFVWQGSLTARGPVTIVAALNERVVHVYRGTTLIGIAPLETASGAPGVYLIAPLKSARGGIQARAVAGDGSTAAAAPLRLPDDFIKLLGTSLSEGGTLIVSAERSVTHVLTDVGPLLTAIERERQRTPSVAGWTATAGEDIAASATSVVVAAPSQGTLDKRGADAPRTLRFALATASVAPGTHVFIRAEPNDAGASWMAVSLGRSAAEPQIGTWLGQQAAEKLALANDADAGKLGASMAPGTVVVVGDRARLVDRKPVVMLSSVDQAVVPQDTAPVRAAAPQQRAAPARKPAAGFTPEFLLKDLDRSGG